jgi:hypothetical protein
MGLEKKPTTLDLVELLDCISNFWKGLFKPLVWWFNMLINWMNLAQLQLASFLAAFDIL